MKLWQKVEVARQERDIGCDELVRVQERLNTIGEYEKLIGRVKRELAKECPHPKRHRVRGCRGLYNDLYETCGICGCENLLPNHITGAWVK